MAKDIEPKLKLISNYLQIKRDEIFVIPEYQRGYSWNLVQCDKLWQDIETFIESEKKEPYFFGTIIADCSETDKISLIDGQQRTTTFLLLLKALLLRLQEVLPNMASDGDSEALYAALKERRDKIVDILYKTDVDGRFDILKDWSRVKDIVVLENNSINELYKDDLQTIIEAENYGEAEYKCYKFAKKQKDNKYTNFFRNFKFFYLKLQEYPESRLNKFAKTFLSECQIIEIRSWQTEQAITMFNSLNSTGLPLADADIISAQLYSFAGDEKERFMELWSNINRMASMLSAHKIIDIDSVLQQYMYIKRASERVYMSEKGGADVTTPGLRRYYTIDCKEILREPFVLCEQLYKITLIWDVIKDYSNVKLLLKFNENAKLFLISYLHRYAVEELSEERISPIVDCLLRLFSVLELVDAGYSSVKFKTFLFGENIKLVDVNVSEEVIESDFNEHIQKSWIMEDIRNSLMEYDKNILVYLNEYLYAKEHGEAFVLHNNVNVEHIMPASGHNIESIRQDAGIGTKDEFKSIVNQLGNKILLEEDINKSISNEWFKTKKQNSIKTKTGYKDSVYHIALDLVNYPSDRWTVDDIKVYTEQAVRRIESFVFGRQTAQ